MVAFAGNWSCGRTNFSNISDLDCALPYENKRSLDGGIYILDNHSWSMNWYDFLIALTSITNTPIMEWIESECDSHHTRFVAHRRTVSSSWCITHCSSPKIEQQLNKTPQYPKCGYSSAWFALLSPFDLRFLSRFFFFYHMCVRSYDTIRVTAIPSENSCLVFSYPYTLNNKHILYAHVYTSTFLNAFVHQRIDIRRFTVSHQVKSIYTISRKANTQTHSTDNTMTVHLWVKICSSHRAWVLVLSAL